jgi:hypothetical protein
MFSLFYIEKDAEIFPVHYTWKVGEKGFKMALIIYKLAMILVKLFLQKKIFLPKIFCEI